MSLETYQNKEWLKEEYITKKRYTKEIAKECNVSVGAISRWTTKFELTKMPNNHKFDYQNKEWLYNEYQNKEWLYNEYVVLRKTKKEIAEQQGVRESTIERWRNKFTITKLKA